MSDTNGPDDAFTRAPVGLATFDGALACVGANPAFAAATLAPEGPITGRAATELFEGAALAGQLGRVRDGGEAFEIEVTRAARTWRVSFFPASVGGGPGVGATAVEITRHLASEREAREHAALLRAISDTSKDLLYAKDRDGRMRFVNPATLRELDRTREQVLGHTDAEYLDDAAAAARLRETDRRIMESGVAEELEEVIEGPDGTPRVWSSRKTPLRDADGVRGLLGISTEITARKRAEEALRRSEAQLRSLFENMTEGFAVADVVRDEKGNVRDATVVEMNDAFERQTGLPRAQVLGRSMRSLLPHLEDAWVEAFGVVADTGLPLRFEPYSRDLDRYFSVYGYRPEPGRFALIFSDVTARRRAEEAVARDQALHAAALREREEALRLANETLREADRHKDEFLAVLSHELRNPLGPIANSLVILERAPAGSAAAVRARQVIDRQARLLTRLIDDLLDLTRVSRGKINLQRERLELNALVRGCVEDQREAFARAAIGLEFEERDAGLFVDADAARLTQIVGNLLNNAAKFTPRGGRTSVTVEAVDGARAVVRVKDDGAGMAPDTLRHVFEPFMQATQTLDRSRGGLGLGLALVKGLVELHGGEVRAQSEGEGHGSQFTVTLPLLAPPKARITAAAASPSTGPGLRIVVVEDRPDAAESLRDVLELCGHEVRVAGSGEEALALARRFRPDVVLSDIGLPGMDGYEVARALRREADPRLRGAFLVALSGYALPEDVAKARDAGFDRHLPKPPQASVLEQLLDEVKRRGRPG